MPKSLYNILVPVDFTSKNKWAITKAIELANTFHCNVHLVHVSAGGLMPLLPLDMSMLMPSYDSADMTNARKKLENLRDIYSNHICGGGKLEISLLKGNPSQQLADYVQKFEMDLVVVGLARFNLLHRVLSTVSISRLARKTNVPVLTIRSSGLVSHFKKIVLPLTDNIPLHRIKFATMLARSFKSTVYLVSLRDEQKEQNAANSIMDTALEVIQSLSTIPVQCFWLEGKNLAKSTLEFSKRINADLIMANPLKEFHMPGWWNRITRKLLSYGSRIPVISDSRITESRNETISAS